jgi:hypothetical protein
MISATITDRYSIRRRLTSEVSSRELGWNYLITMPEVKLHPTRFKLVPFLTPTTQADRTNGGTYEFLPDHTFEAVNYIRYMSWKGGKGHIIMGARKLATDTDEVNGQLDPGWTVTVKGVDFKLVNTVS